MLETKNASRKRTKGFTLIELVVVITILGLLVAYALPKFIAMQADARLAKVNGALGSVRSAAALAHAQLLVRGYPANHNGAVAFSIEGVSPTYVNGYPSAAFIARLAGLEAQDFGIPSASGGQQAIQAGPQHTSCGFVYREALPDNAPTYDISGLVLANCA